MGVVRQPVSRLVRRSFSLRERTDMRGVLTATLIEEGGPRGKHGFLREASAPEAREAR